jgi:phosphate starvation-inducible membrane PsiE
MVLAKFDVYIRCSSVVQTVVHSDYLIERFRLAQVAFAETTTTTGFSIVELPLEPLRHGRQLQIDKLLYFCFLNFIAIIMTGFLSHP